RVRKPAAKTIRSRLSCQSCCARSLACTQYSAVRKSIYEGASLAMAGVVMSAVSSCFFNSISEWGSSLTRALAFVPLERSLRPRVGFFAPLRDKVTSSAQSLSPSGQPSQGSSQPILTEPRDELAPAAHSITSSAMASSEGGTVSEPAVAGHRAVSIASANNGNDQSKCRVSPERNFSPHRQPGDLARQRPAVCAVISRCG